MKYPVARFWEPGPQGRARCRLCPHQCGIADGKSGRCGVRRNEGGQLVPVNYGQISSLALDPIEKKPLHRYRPGSMILSAGSLGCNFSCPFCQNHSISMARPGEVDTVFLSPSDLVERAETLRSRSNIGIAFTYNEPFTWYEYVRDTALLAREKGLDIVLVTNGYVEPEPLEEILPFVCAMNIDLKSFRDSFYREMAGGTLEPVLETIRRSTARCHVEVTTLVIPGHTDSKEEIRELAAFLAGISPEIPLHLTRFFPAYRQQDTPPTSRESLDALAREARKSLKHVFLGNV